MHCRDNKYSTMHYRDNICSIIHCRDNPFETIILSIINVEKTAAFDARFARIAE